MSDESPIWKAQEGPQLEAIRRDLIDELFYGGAVGGGKSDYLLGDFAQDVYHPVWGKHWRGILFRRTYGELEELISRSKEIYPQWFGLNVSKCWSESKSQWTWPNGAQLKLRYLEHSTDWMRYWGHQYTWIGFDELPTWPDMTAYVKMKARLRSAHIVRNKRIRATGNPGGPGHQAVRTYFRIDEYPLGGVVFDDGGMKRMFIRSRLSDNKILMQADPGYANRLSGLGSKDLVRAWLEGDWSVVAGAFFTEFSSPLHIVQPISLPKRWIRFRAMDWGSARPFSVGWYAVSDGELPQFPRGALVKYREWYGMLPNQPNVGLKLTADEVAVGIKKLEAGDSIAYGVLDPSAFARDGGPSIAERMMAKTVIFRPADNKRVSQRGAMGGWDQVRARLKGDDKPMLYFFSTCTHTIRTLPSLQHDAARPEDIDTDAEDHAADETRYACMSRPWVGGIAQPESKPDRYQSTDREEDSWKTA